MKQQKIVLENNVTLLNIKLQSQSFYFKMVELKKLLQKSKSDTILSQTHQDLFLDLEQLENLLESNFDLTLN